jgi:hypothetical protein
MKKFGSGTNIPDLQHLVLEQILSMILKYKDPQNIVRGKEKTGRIRKDIVKVCFPVRQRQINVFFSSPVAVAR